MCAVIGMAKLAPDARDRAKVSSCPDSKALVFFDSLCELGSRSTEDDSPSSIQALSSVEGGALVGLSCR